MLDRVVLVALTPLALAGGTATSWLQAYWHNSASQSVAASGGTRAITANPLAIVRGSDGMLHTIARINGVAVDMIVDTGASRTILSEHDTQRVFGTRTGLKRGRIRTLAGERDLQIQTAATVEIGRQSLGPLDTATVDGGEVSVIGLDWLGLVGPVTIGPTS